MGEGEFLPADTCVARRTVDRPNGDVVSRSVIRHPALPGFRGDDKGKDPAPGAKLSSHGLHRSSDVKYSSEDTSIPGKNPPLPPADAIHGRELFLRLIR